MDYIEALRLFGFTSNFTKEELKKRYLELSKKYHPDLNGDEEMMKKVNMAYEILKKHNESYAYNACSKLIKYYDDLKSKLTFYTSKTIYLPDTLEFKYANAIANVVDTFTFDKVKQLIEFKYTVAIGSIKDLFKSYKKEILKNVPESFAAKFETITDECPFDEYVKDVNKIRIKYEKIDKVLNQVLISTSANKKIDIKIIDDFFTIKEAIINDITDKKITLEDGIYRLQAEIKARVLKKEELDNKIWDTYKAIMNNFNKRMMELKPTDTENIDIAMKVFNEAMITLKAVQNGTKDEEVLSILSDLTFTNSDELKESEYELYITANFSDNEEPEIVLKKGENENCVYFNRRYKDGSVLTWSVGKDLFYKKYSKFKDVLKRLDFLGDKGYVQYLNTKFMTTALYYYENAGCYIVLTENDEIIIAGYNKFDSLSYYATDDASRTYKDKQALYDKIYESFFERKEKMKYKTNENNILKREKNK